MVFLILAGQYEKWSLPVGVLMAVPFALFGALLAILMRGLENDIYFQIGLTMLVALAAKNAILIFEFAVINREGGASVLDATLRASEERLRPIVMTSLAFILGCVPLAIAVGASANSRHSIGTGVIGGMLGATVIAVFSFRCSITCSKPGRRVKAARRRSREQTQAPREVRRL